MFSTQFNIDNNSQEIEGELRIAISSDLGRNLVAPWLDEFMTEHTKISVRLHMSDSQIDFYRDNLDMAIRYGSPADSNLYGFKICDVQSFLCASPEYLKQHGEPKHPEELAQHNGLFYQLYDVTHDHWIFSRNAESIKVRMSSDRSANDGDMVRRWCLAGKGLAVKSCVDVGDDILAKRLVSLMSDYKPRTTELWQVFPSRSSITPAARLFRDFLRQKCETLIARLVDAGHL